MRRQRTLHSKTKPKQNPQNKETNKQTDPEQRKTKQKKQTKKKPTAKTPTKPSGGHLFLLQHKSLMASTVSVSENISLSSQSQKTPSTAVQLASLLEYQ